MTPDVKHLIGPHHLLAGRDRTIEATLERARGGVRTRWLLSWPGLAALGVINGATRELVYSEALGDELANQVSTGTLIMMIVAFTWYLQRRWPLISARETLAIGVIWAVMTVVFELGFGHYVDGQSWSDLLGMYKIWNGELWPLVVLVMGAGPSLVRIVSRRRTGA